MPFIHLHNKKCPLNATHSELEREANIAKNRALFEDLGLKQAVKDLGASKPAGQSRAKPVQPKTRVKREREETELAPRRQSRRLKLQHGDYSNETPEERKIREVLSKLKGMFFRTVNSCMYRKRKRKNA